MVKHRIARWSLAVTILVASLLGFGANAQAEVNNQQSEYHQVVSGETLWSISQQYQVSVRQLMAWNKLANPNKLYTGQTLLIMNGNPDNYSNNDEELLARLIYAEARGENFEGQVAVGAVVINRLKSPEFPKTLQGVIYQPGAFTAIQDRQIKLSPNQTAMEAAKEAIDGVDPTGGALFYYNPETAQDHWIKTRPVIKVIGNHNFTI